jgi:hypothetical protein
MPAPVRCSRRFAAIVILLSAAGLGVPYAATAAEISPEDRVAILGVYQMECAPLNARLKALMTELSQSLDGDRIAVRVTEKRQDLETSGKKQWCATARKTVVQPLERQR